jgi:transcriptional regulator GlxA family with amidase domain
MSELAKFPKSIGIVLYPGFEVLDAAGPIEALNCLAFSPGDKDLKFSIISRSMEAVRPGANSFTLSQGYLPTHTFDNAPQLDMLLVPGGFGSFDWLPGTENNNVDDYIDYVKRAYHGYGDKKPLQYIMSVCNGTILLAKAGILDGRKATTNKDFYYDITKLGPKTHWLGRARWVADGNVWTTSGVSAGADGMLAFMEGLMDKKWVTSVVNMMEWRRAESADDDPFADVEGTKDVLPVAA